MWMTSGSAKDPKPGAFRHGEGVIPAVIWDLSRSGGTRLSGRKSLPRRDIQRTRSCKSPIIAGIITFPLLKTPR